MTEHNANIEEAMSPDDRAREQIEEIRRAIKNGELKPEDLKREDLPDIQPLDPEPLLRTELSPVPNIKTIEETNKPMTNDANPASTANPSKLINNAQATHEQLIDSSKDKANREKRVKCKKHKEEPIKTTISFKPDAYRLLDEVAHRTRRAKRDIIGELIMREYEEEYGHVID